MVIYALHGFLGKPSDWRPLFCKHEMQCIDLFNQFSNQSIAQWAQEFNSHVAAQKGNPKVLMGYSLGGRLALHALLAQPNLWSGAIFISTHPGLESNAAKEERRKIDAQWAARFLHEDWTSLMQAWNEQSVFEEATFIRNEIDYRRDRLSQVLLNWSLSKQANLLDQIALLDLPILWLTGKKDIKYCAVAKKVVLKHPGSEVCEISEGGHRLPWDNPECFENKVQQFINSVYN